MIRRAYRTGLEAGRKHAMRHWERHGLVGVVAGFFGLLTIAQLAYPWQNLPLYATIDGVAVGNQPADRVTKKLDDTYSKKRISLYFGTSTKPYRQPLPSEIGLTISSRPQVEAKAYNIWLRLVPSSLFWAHIVAGSPGPEYVHDQRKAGIYVKKELGDSCSVKTQNATLTYKEKKLQVIPAIDGGTCRLSDVEKMLNTVRPTLANNELRIPMDEYRAPIDDGKAKDTAKQLMSRTQTVTVQAGDSTLTIPQETLLSWLDFTAPDSGIVATVNTSRANDFLTQQLAPKVAVSAGISYITTLDFNEVSRADGITGRALDTDATVRILNQWLGGDDVRLAAQVRPVPPTPKYTRTYTQTDTGLAALLAQFAQSHNGTFGISYAELDSDHRHAGYQDTRVFRTASTYKLFVAYSTLKRIESGQWQWSDQIQGGRNLTKCFDDMIVKSDNACAEALLGKIGYTAITKEIQAIGLGRSTFLKSFIQTTSADLATFLGALHSGQLLTPTSTNTLLSAMKRNIYRQGIPAGANVVVADKVGFLDAFLHDAAIVYSPSGTYVLVAMTDGSNWGTIAELARQIENWRSQ